MVYVDDANLPYGRMNMSHMIADTPEELLAMVDKIGVQRKWIQYPGTPREHFDVCASKRELAIQYGAKPITWEELGRMTAARRKAKKEEGHA